jgi:hypothetical protein
MLLVELCWYTSRVYLVENLGGRNQREMTERKNDQAPGKGVDVQVADGNERG